MADLPEFRIDIHQPPVFHTAVDYFGPFMVRQGRITVKRYGCVFTSMVSRAIHIEVLHYLSEDSFISGLRRFVGRKGKAVHLYSDIGTNFVGADRILTESVERWNQKQISEFLPLNEIDWHFNTPWPAILAASGND